MAETLKVLAQLDVPASLTALYTVPALTQVTVSSLVICNRSAASRTFRVSVAVGGAADSVEQYLYYDAVITKNSTFAASLGLTLGAGDVVRVLASAAGNLSAALYGVEVT
jgi:hypothetical protein